MFASLAEPGVLTAIVSGGVSIAIALIGIRASASKIKADTEASLALKAAEDQAKFRQELLDEVGRLRTDCDRLAKRVVDLERELVAAERARMKAEAERDAALLQLRGGALGGGGAAPAAAVLSFPQSGLPS